MNRAMNGEIAANKLADVTITVKPLPLTAAQVRALGQLPNVAAVDPRGHLFDGVYVGARWQTAFLIGKVSFAHQTVDAVTVTTGSAPGPGAVLTRRAERRLRSWRQRCRPIGASARRQRQRGVAADQR